LEKIEAGGRAVTLGVVTRRDELHDLSDIAARAEIAGERDQHIRSIAGGAQQFLINGHGAGEVFGFEFLACGGEERFHA
jgi:hypothetical protein